MSTDNFNFLRDLEQIAERQRAGSKVLAHIAEQNPVYAEDLRRMQEKTQTIADDLEDILRREREKNRNK